MPLWVRPPLCYLRLTVPLTRHRLPCPLPQVDKYRPNSLDKLIVHQDIGANLRNLARAPLPAGRGKAGPRWLAARQGRVCSSTCVFVCRLAVGVRVAAGVCGARHRAWRQKTQ